VPHDHPIIVIGAGPCGSFAALTMVQKHVPVTVLEEHRKIGIPSHCAGHVGIKGLSRLGLEIPYNIVQNRIRGAKFYSPSCRELVLDHGSPVTYVLDRAKFDLWLADQAVRSGATYLLNTRVRSLRQEKGRIMLSIEEPESTKELHSGLVIDAEGCPPALLRAAGLGQTYLSNTVNGVIAEVDNLTGVDDEFVELYFGKEYVSGFFAWIIPKGDGSAKIGLGVKGRDPIRLLHKFVSRHPVASRKVRNSKLSNFKAHPIPLSGPFSKTYTNGVLCVGDAASQVKPTTGGGIITGMLCSRIAGEVGTEAWKRSDYTTRFLSRYQSQWRKMIWKDFLVMKKVRTYLDRLSDEKMNHLFELVLKTGIINDMRTLDDIDLQGSSFLSLTRRPRTLLNLIRFILLAINQ
jgi:digeranylgeranylglycerophospholipid reductase